MTLGLPELILTQLVITEFLSIVDWSISAVFILEKLVGNNADMPGQPCCTCMCIWP